MGRSSVMMVIGFNMVFMAIGFNISKISTTAYENYLQYFNRSTAHRIAASAANMACSEVSFVPNWRAGYSNVSYLGGEYTVVVSDLDSGRIQITSDAEYNGSSARVRIVLGISSFSKFAYFSNIEGGIYWITGDTVWGPFHTQQKLTVAGEPVFYGKVTSKNGLQKNPSSSKPKFYGGFQRGISIDLPSNLNPLVAAAQNGGAYFNNEDLWLTLNANATVTVRVGSATATPTTTPLATFAPNGVILANNGNMHIQGHVSGKLTISATGSSGAAKGNVWVDSSVTYVNSPLSGGSSDMLGIVADNNVIVTDNANNSGNVNVHATVFSRSGGLTAENHNTRAAGGTLSVLGGIQQYQRGPVGAFSGSGTIATGFRKNYKYDERLYVDTPPFFPTTGSYEVLSWYE